MLFSQSCPRQFWNGPTEITDNSSTNSNFEEGDFEEEEGDGNLNENEIQEIHNILDRSELGNQGFVASVSTPDDGKPVSSPQSEWEGVQSIAFNGRTFQVGQCYSYLKPNAAYCGQIWIWEFASEKTTYYVKLVLQASRFLGLHLSQMKT